MGNSVRYVVFYDSGDLSLAAENFPAHRAWYGEFMARGVLLSLGPFTDRADSMAIFTTLEAAEEFAAGDPFVVDGTARITGIRPWADILGVA